MMRVNTCEDVQDKVSVSYGPITFFENVLSTTPSAPIYDGNDSNDGHICDLHKLISSGGAGLRKQIRNIRKVFDEYLCSTKDLKAAKRAISGLKLRLAAVCVGGSFRARRNDAIKEYSGLICIDIDDLQNNAVQVRDRLSQDPHALLTFLSPSGQGVKCVFKVDTPVEKHKEAFEALTSYLKDLHAIAVDESGKDVARACFLSYDPDARYNPDAKIFVVPAQTQSFTEKGDTVTTDLDKYIQANFKVIKVVEDGYYIECPGKDKHTGQNMDRDCMVFTEGAPKIHCFHQSCNTEVKRIQKLLNKRFGSQAKPKTRDTYDRVRDHLEKLEYFHTKDDETYVVLENGRSYRTGSSLVRAYIDRTAWGSHKGQLNQNQIDSAVGFLHALARFEGEMQDIHLRVAGDTSEVIIDKSQGDSSCIVCTRDGWGEYDQSPVRFATQRGMLPLFEPHRKPDCSIQSLHKFMNLDQESFTMVYGYLLNCFNPLGPYLVGVVTGQQGSAKTTHCKQIKRLIDPHSAPARQSNIKSNDIAIAARNNYMLLVDNVSGISTEVSDMICQISTGGSFGSRRLYQNDEEHYFSFKRPVILNGIDEIATRGDLADRSAPIRLSAIPEEARKSDLEIEALFMNFGPQIMSSILEGVCSAIRHIPTVSPPYKSRMAGAVQWITASEYGLKLRPGTFSQTYERVREEEANYRITEYPVGRAIVALLKRNNNWSGSSSVLLEDLVRYSIDAERYSSLWPKDAAGLGRILRRIEPDLGKAGINIEYHRSASGRKIRLQKKPK